jgi:hypothetical protein
VGLAIIILLIGIPIGLYMLLQPKKLWWKFSAWQYKNPEANEPSESGYGVWALRGVVVIAVTAVLAWLVATKPADNTEPASSPNPQARGALPIVDYQIEDGYLKVGYRKPYDATAMSDWTAGESPNGCSLKPTIDGLGTDRVTVDLRLYWTHRSGNNYDQADDEKCRVTGMWAPYLTEIQVAKAAPGTSVLTNGVIADSSGKVLTPAAQGNVVPERNP